MDNSSKKLTVKEKNEIILTSKKLISFCKSGCNFNRSLFNDYDEVISECNRIAEYGDISSVRRACKLINENLHEDIEPKLSDEKKKELEVKENIKKFSNPTLQIKRGKIIVEF